MSTFLSWVGIGWKDPSIGGGMADCDMFVIENGKVTDLYANSNSQPLVDSQQDCSIVAQKMGSNGLIYYTVNKLNPSKDSNDRNIVDMTYQLQYAWGQSSFGDHFGNKGKTSVNFFKQADFVNTTDYTGDSTDNGNSQDNTNVEDNNENEDEANDTNNNNDVDVDKENENENNEEESDVELDANKDGRDEIIQQKSNSTNKDSALLLLIPYTIALII